MKVILLLVMKLKSVQNYCFLHTANRNKLTCTTVTFY